jgi:hypothetical protein
MGWVARGGYRYRGLVYQIPPPPPTTNAFPKQAVIPSDRRSPKYHTKCHKFIPLYFNDRELFLPGEEGRSMAVCLCTRVEIEVKGIARAQYNTPNHLSGAMTTTG